MLSAQSIIMEIKRLQEARLIIRNSQWNQQDNGTPACPPQVGFPAWCVPAFGLVLSAQKSLEW